MERWIHWEGREGNKKKKSLYFLNCFLKVAVFDTGLSRRTYYINNVVERKDWTNENTLEDGVGERKKEKESELNTFKKKKVMERLLLEW